MFSGGKKSSRIRQLKKKFRFYRLDVFRFAEKYEYAFVWIDI